MKKQKNFLSFASYNNILFFKKKFVHARKKKKFLSHFVELSHQRVLKFWQLRRGGEVNEEEIRQALLKKAIGFESDEIVEEYTADENGNAILSKRKITKKFNPPDINALRFLLEQSSLEDDFSKMTDEELLKEKERLLQLLKEKEKEENENGNL